MVTVTNLLEKILVRIAFVNTIKTRRPRPGAFPLQEQEHLISTYLLEKLFFRKAYSVWEALKLVHIPEIVWWVSFLRICHPGTGLVQRTRSWSNSSWSRRSLENIKKTGLFPKLGFINMSPGICQVIFLLLLSHTHVHFFGKLNTL